MIRKTLSSLALAALSGATWAAPVVVTPGSVAGYLYVPAVVSGGSVIGGGEGSPSSGQTSCTSSIRSGRVVFLVPSNTEIEYSITGGGGGGGDGGDHMSVGGGGGGGGSTGVLKNGVLIGEAVGGSGGGVSYFYQVAAVAGDTKYGSFSAEKGDKIEVIIGGGGGATGSGEQMTQAGMQLVSRGGGGGAGYSGGSGGDGENDDGAPGSYARGGNGGAFSGSFGQRGDGFADGEYFGGGGGAGFGASQDCSTGSYCSGGGGGSVIGGGGSIGAGGGAFGGGGGSGMSLGVGPHWLSMNGAAMGADVSTEHDGVAAIGVKSGSAGAPGHTGSMPRGGDGGAARFSYTSSGCWIPEY